MSTSKALNELVPEAQEIIDGLSKGLLKLGEVRGGDVDPELVNSVFRQAHSLKGIAGIFGVTQLATVAHGAEDLLDDMRMGRVPLADDVLDLLLEAVEIFQRILGDLANPTATPPDGVPASRAARLLARIHERRGAPVVPGADPLEAVGVDAAIRNVLTEYEEHRLRENLKKGGSLFRVAAAFNLPDFDEGLSELNACLKPLGEVISTLPSTDPWPEGGIALSLLFGTSCPLETVEESLAGLPVQVRAMGEPVPTVSLLPSPSPQANGGEGHRSAPRNTSLRSASQTVRVDIRKLDRLMNIVGELVLAKTNLQRLADVARPGRAERTDVSAELSRETRLLERKLDELQEGLLEVRMVPLNQVFDKLARMVRTIARDAGKEIDLQVAGGDVELDKLIVEDLSDPLMHIIRNAVDHGIEPPHVRAYLGKPRRGRVSLAAKQRGNHVVIEVTDDGAGIDEGAVRNKAIERGLTTAEASRDLARRDILSFIFLPGFSTARQVSELSGRGVGLDVVKTNIANLSGIIDLTTRRGEGTTFSITVPVTLAILRALVVSVADRVYAIPLNVVLEIIAVKKDEVRVVEGREKVEVRGATLSLVRLAKLFELSGAGDPDHLFVVVVGLARDRLGIAVDQLLGQQDVVVKPLGKLLAGIRGISGATDLGNRRTVLVLDVGAILDEVLANERALLETFA